MSALKECLSALIFTDLEWALNEFDITKKKADQLVCDFDTIQKMEFVTKAKRKIVQMKKSLSRIKISQQTGLPLIVVNYILNQAEKDNKQEINIEQEESQSDSEDTLIFKSKQSQSITSTQELAPESQQIKKKTKIEPKEEQKKEQKKEQQKEVKQQVKQLNSSSEVKEKEKQKIGQTKEKQQNVISGKPVEQQKKEFKNNQQQDVKGGKNSTILSKDKDKDQKAIKILNKENQQQIPAANSRKEILNQQDKKIVSLTKSGIVVQNRNQKQYICYYCSKTFNEGMNLSKHFNTSHPNQDHLTLFCSLCKDLTFENFSTYFSHIKNHKKKRESMKYT